MKLGLFIALAIILFTGLILTFLLVITGNA